MKSHVILLSRVLEDSGILCCTSTTRDLNTVTRRVKDEGGSFLTLTLPTFAKDLERALDQGAVNSTHFAGFARRAGLPVFLRGFLSQIFDKWGGVLLDDPSIDAIQSVRQICYLFHKVELPCSEERERQAFKDYIECEQSILDLRKSFRDPQLVAFRRIANVLFGEMFSRVDSDVYHGNIIPKHGPGSTADRVSGNAKYANKTWTERLEEVFPAMDFLYPSARHYFNAIEDGNGPVWLEPGAEQPVRVISVPKTLKTPRIIAIEPVHMQYVQQGLMEKFVEGIERDDSFLGNFIGFSDQEPNRTLACQGSRDQSLATLDLSEASDRVSIQHVENLLSGYDWLARAVFSCRSTKAEVPGYGIRTLSKFASMGSALTFPIEAMVFLTVIFVGIEEKLSTHVSKDLVKGLIGKVRVYGDDIIVPVEYVQSVVDALEDFGLKVNRHKSFWTGRFRESCGGEYYAGHDVGIVKTRRVLPEQRQHTQEIISAVSLRNQLYFSGYWRTAEFLDGWIGKYIPFPTVHEASPGLGRHTVLDYEVQRLCPHLQRPLVRAAVVRGLPPKSFLGESDALLKHFLKRGDEPFADRNHLRRAGRPDAVDINIRWVPPY